MIALLPAELSKTEQRDSLQENCVAIDVDE